MSVDTLHNVDDVYPLTPTQEGMLYHTLVQPGSGVYVEQYSCVFDVGLDFAKFRKAWEIVVARHDVLRTCFMWDGLDEPLQVVRSNIELPWQLVDWRSLNKDSRREEFEAVTKGETAAGFDLARAPLMRFLLARESDTQTRFVWSFHHMLLDGWSRALVFGDVLDEYIALTDGDSSLAHPDPPQFRDYVNWLQQRDTEEARTYWINYLEGAQATRLPRLSRTHRSGSSAQDVFSFPSALVDRLREFGREHRLTLSTILHGCCAIVIGRYAGVDEPVLGTTTSGRAADLDQSDAIAGMLMSTYPFKAVLDKGASTVSWLQQLQQQLAESRQFEFASMGNIQRWTGRAGHPLFDTLVSLTNYPDDYRRRTVRIVDETYVDRSNYPLALIFAVEPELKLYAVYERSSFDSWFVDNLFQSILSVATSLVDGSATLGGLRSMTPTQQTSLVKIEKAGVQEWGERTIAAGIEQNAAANANRLAVRMESGAGLTYAELIRFSNDIAAHLGKACDDDGHVALLMDSSPMAMAAMIACLRSGVAYVPIDPRYPAARISQILRDARPAVITTTKQHADLVPSDVEILLVDEMDSSGMFGGGVSRQDSDPAYVIYTSGSTGGPKGVVVSRGNLRNSTFARLTYYKEPVERFLLLSSMSFDSSVAGIYWTLCSGGTLVVPETSIVQDLDRLSNLIESQEITHTLCLPSVYHSLLQYADVKRLRSLKTVIVAGEACSSSVARLHFEKLPECRLYNEYGPTEATVWSTVHRISREDAVEGVPIGRPILNTAVCLLDDDLNRVPPGAVGDIHLGGHNLALGYLRRPQATESAFVSDPSSPKDRLYRTGDLGRYRPDGSIEFIGRKDRQIKVRGYRIETDEVVSVIRECPGVGEAVVHMGSADGTHDLERLEERLLQLDSSTRNSLLSRLESV